MDELIFDGRALKAISAMMAINVFLEIYRCLIESFYAITVFLTKKIRIHDILDIF